ncbi:MAG: serine hydrolase domain-containing protein [Woeseiaceae bacterium]
MRVITTTLVLVTIAGCAMHSEKPVDHLFADYSGEGMPGAAVMVVKDGKPVLTKSYGMANIEAGTKIEPRTNFRLASITKQFTATAILKLVERGKLDLDDSIRRYFPEFATFADSITVRHILQHTSGIQDYEPLYGDQFPEQVNDRGVVEIISRTDSANFAAGSDYRYSNSGYAILAVLVEKLSGMSFPEFLHQNLFAPLDMSGTVAYVDGVTTVIDRAFGYRIVDSGVEYADQSAWSAVLGDGGVYSSVVDLIKWDQALYAGGLLPQALREASFTPGLENYGFGFRIDEYKSHKRIHHSGSTSGFRNHMQQFPDERLTIIILTNRAEPDVTPLAEQIADLYLD